MKNETGKSFLATLALLLIILAGPVSVTAVVTLFEWLSHFGVGR